MLKLINLTLSKIKYTGDAIGDDIRVEIQCLNNFFGLNKAIKNGTKVVVNAGIAHFVVDQASYNLPLDIKIIERDLIFNDVGSKRVEIKIDLRNSSSQVSTHEITVKERRGLYAGRRTATFALTIEAVVEEAVRYVPNTEDGWIVGIREDNHERVSLPTYLKVRFDRVQLKREYLNVLEGPLQGIQVSVKLDSRGKSYLLQDNPHTDPIFLTYSISKRTLRIKNKTYQTNDTPDAQWKAGMYDVEIPDAPHQGGHNYPDAKYATIWFRIGHSGDRYIHTGRHSLGCITLIEQKKWDSLCETLLKGRKGDGKSVGVLEVIA